MQQRPGVSTGITLAMHTDVITQSKCETAKMLVVLPDEERRLITFTLPTESCTVVELLEQVGIVITPNMQVRCVAISDEALDYVVTITEEQDLPVPAPAPPPPAVQQVPMGIEGMHQRKDFLVVTNNPPQTAQPPPPPVHVPKLIEGYLAVCDYCGFHGVSLIVLMMT